MRTDRRTFLASLGALVAGACTRPRTVRAPAAVPVDHLARARDAATYLRTLAVETEHGLLWRKSPDEPGEMGRDLYHGSAGPALFFLELARATGEATYLDDARRGVDHLIATTPDKPESSEVGIFGGLAGHGPLYLELARTTGEARYLDAARDTVTRLEAAATPSDAGGVAIGGGHDIFHGVAGAITWLLHAHAELGDDRARALAVRAGDGLVARGEPADGGRRWLARPGMTYEMPNFSHGTSGCAYALARLYQETREERFLAAAVAGAEHLLAIAHTAGDVCLVPHAIPGDGAERYYLSYCHGPAGTARLFHVLAEITGERRWADWFRRSIHGVLTSGVPEARTPGFWDNVGQCCGNASLAELMLSMHRLTDDAGYRDYADLLVDDVLARATPAAGGGLEWIHAENRIEPYWRQSYTGYMQGAAGIGSLLVRRAGHDRREAWKVRLPDNPFPV